MKQVQAGFWMVLMAALAALTGGALWTLLAMMLNLPGFPGAEARPLQAMAWTALFVPCLAVGVEMCFVRAKNALGRPLWAQPWTRADETSGGRRVRSIPQQPSIQGGPLRG